MNFSKISNSRQEFPTIIYESNPAKNEKNLESLPNIGTNKNSHDEMNSTNQH